MKIKREKLLEIVRQQKLKMITDQDERAERYRERIVRERSDYIAQTRDLWSGFAHAIYDAVNRREPITYELVPEGLRTTRYDGYLRFYDVPKVKAEMSVTESKNYRTLTALEQILQNVTDDEVSTYALEKMGVSLAGLIKL